MSSVKCTNSVAPLGVRVKVSKWLKENWLLVGAAGAGALLLQQSHRKSIDEINAKYEAKHEKLKTEYSGRALVIEQNILLTQELDELGKTAHANFTELYNLRRQVRSRINNSVQNSDIISTSVDRVKAKLSEDPNLGDKVTGGVYSRTFGTLNQWLASGGAGLSRTYGRISNEVANIGTQDDLLMTSHAFFDPDELFYNVELSYLYANAWWRVANLHDNILTIKGKGDNFIVDDQVIGWNTTPTYSKLMWFVNQNRHLSDPVLTSMPPEDLNAVLNEMTRAIKYVSPIEAEIINGLNDKLGSTSQLKYFQQRKKDAKDDWISIVYDIYGSANYTPQRWNGSTDATGQKVSNISQLDMYQLNSSPRLTAFFEKNPAVQ